MTSELTKITLKGISDNLTFIAKGNSNHWVVMDTDESIGGNDAGTRPMELILQGLAGCTGMDVISILKKKRIKIDRFEMEVNSIRGDVHPKVFTNITILFKFWGPDIAAGAVERAIELSETKYCGVSAMLRKTAEITTDYVINQD